MGKRESSEIVPQGAPFFIFGPFEDQVERLSCQHIALAVSFLIETVTLWRDSHARQQVLEAWVGMKTVEDRVLVDRVEEDPDGMCINRLFEES